VLCRMTLLWVAGCAIRRTALPVVERPFQFENDTFAFANELKWVYAFDDTTGQCRASRRQPPPDTRCAVSSSPGPPGNSRACPVRSRLPVADGRNLSGPGGPGRVPQPLRGLGAGRARGHPGLPESAPVQRGAANDSQGAVWRAWQSYVQSGHWRMILPFTRRHQEKRPAARCHRSRRTRRRGSPGPVSEPTINHAVVLVRRARDGQRYGVPRVDPTTPRAVADGYDQSRRSSSFRARDTLRRSRERERSLSLLARRPRRCSHRARPISSRAGAQTRPQRTPGRKD